jgi:hypothetical protein
MAPCRLPLKNPTFPPDFTRITPAMHLDCDHMNGNTVDADNSKSSIVNAATITNACTISTDISSPTAVSTAACVNKPDSEHENEHACTPPLEVLRSVITTRIFTNNITSAASSASTLNAIAINNTAIANTRSRSSIVDTNAHIDTDDAAADITTSGYSNSNSKRLDASDNSNEPEYECASALTSSLSIIHEVPPLVAPLLDKPEEPPPHAVVPHTSPPLLTIPTTHTFESTQEGRNLNPPGGVRPALAVALESSTFDHVVHLFSTFLCFLFCLAYCCQHTDCQTLPCDACTTFPFGLDLFSRSLS